MRKASIKSNIFKSVTKICRLKRIYLFCVFFSFVTITVINWTYPVGKNPDARVKRIYYINMAKNTKRRAMMEEWLQKQTIPYERVEALTGTYQDHCPERFGRRRCRGIAGIAKTNLGIIRTRDVSGQTLVFEDDFFVERNLTQAVEATLQLVPNDWDIIRWDCVGPIRTSFPVLFQNATLAVFRTAHLLPCREDTCNFCGGTHAMLWRKESLSKIEQLWAMQPYDDIDCRLVTTHINGYCVNMDLGTQKPPEDEHSDITYIKEEEK